MPHGSTYRLDYVTEPSHRWPVLLDEARRGGASRVATFVPWGAHEKTPGARDFTSVSRLQIERFFGMVQERGLRLEVRFGFVPSHDAFPSWALAAERKSLVPIAVWEGERDDFALTEIPSPSDPSVRGAFLEYTDELLGIVSLYSRDQGPVDNIRLDLSLVQSDVGVLAEASFDGLLRARYPSIEDLNAQYGTSLKDFSALGRRSGIRLLLDRRPWLASFDYKWCRAHSVAALWEGVHQAARRHRLEDLLYAAIDRDERDDRDAAPRHAWEIAFDPVPIDRVEGISFPFLPEGLVCQSSLQAFRLWEALGERAVEWGCRVTRLPLWDDWRKESSPLVVVAAGKYLPEASFAWLSQHAEKGGHVFFPFAVPKYDETMRCHDWPGIWTKTSLATGGHRLQRLAAGGGSLWTASPSLSPTDESLRALPELVEKIRSAEAEKGEPS